MSICFFFFVFFTHCAGYISELSISLVKGSCIDGKAFQAKKVAKRHCALVFTFSMDDDKS